VIFYTVDEPEPLLLRNKGLLRKDVEEMLWETYYTRFQLGNIVSVVGGMSELVVSEAQ
jgi:hypothetical protein